MKKSALFLGALTLVAFASAFATITDDLNPFEYLGHTFDGSTLTVQVANSGLEPASATLTVRVPSNGVVAQTIVTQVSLAGGETGSILVTIHDDIYPVNGFQFDLSQ